MTDDAVCIVFILQTFFFLPEKTIFVYCVHSSDLFHHRRHYLNGFHSSDLFHHKRQYWCIVFILLQTFSTTKDNIDILYSFFIPFIIEKKFGTEMPDQNGQWYQHLLTLFAFFTRAVLKGLTFGLCLP